VEVTAEVRLIAVAEVRGDGRPIEGVTESFLQYALAVRMHATGMSEPTRHTGGCHCGKVRFAVTCDTTKATACNCSICSKMGWLLAFAPAGAFELVSGEDELTDYQFHNKHIHHVFCRTCGVRSFGWGNTKTGDKMYSVNLRCLDDVDANAAEVTWFDGKSL